MRVGQDHLTRENSPTSWIRSSNVREDSMTALQGLGPRNLSAHWKRENMVKAIAATKTCVAALLFLAATALTSSAATTFTTLASFNALNGAGPTLAPLVQGLDGNFYGTTS